MSVDLDHIQQVLDEADCLYNEQQIEEAIKSMGSAITEQLSNSNPLVYCVMNGGMVITGKLLTHLQFPLEASYVHATRYRDQLTGGRLDWRVRPSQDMKGRTVLIVDDILDEGHTLDAIVDFCKEQGAEQVMTAVLVDKLHNRKARPDLKADFYGLEIEDRYIFGYGLDYQGYWRNANGIFALKGH
ncbi:hypoxanthine-guanine phosphoribosyltransferase [Endozoicomonas numazuensis]|uniref:Hypoxanthine-guanine phosphoribosyltransferase n=1 Tax=Endozoicomonas numazuensis TaxID=1137799 RepID=A0A081NK45_9GAMM|nr:hypoxanthine-guanine phosphoribosyltransferase [Endozoicomonas numazuensis]KEQ18818.1 hypoxanthine-guanine phosphoribosyltransferase [Endozoicomonas numazuensis]